MIETVAGIVQKILTHPLDEFRRLRNEDTQSLARYFLILLSINAILSALVSLAGLGALNLIRRTMHIPHPLFIFFLVLLGGLIITPLFAAWLHLWIIAIGGKAGFSQTIKAVMYGNTPGLLFGWIPVIGIFFYFWSLVLVIFGVYELHQIEGDRAAFAVILAVIVPVVILAIIASLFFFGGLIAVIPVARAIVP